MKGKKIFGVVGCILILLIVAIPLNAANAEPPKLSVKDMAEIAEQELLPLEGITGISYTEDEGVASLSKVIVYIESEEYRSIVPQEIEGFKTEIRVSGKFVALGMPQQSIVISQYKPQFGGYSRKGRCSPLVGGVSIGNKFNTAGTLAIAISTSSSQLLLSNTHVFAMDSSGHHLPKGIAIIQPGRADGGGDTIAQLSRYARIRFGWMSIIFPNYVDAAIATMTNCVYSPFKVLDKGDKTTYTVSLSCTTPSVGDTVRKSGRTTAVTTNEVLDTHATVTVWYGHKYARFKDQILVKEPFIEPGDSGSFVDKDGHFVGLVFAGSDQYAIVCKAWRIRLTLQI